MGYLSKAVSTTASYLPAQVTDTLNQTRAVATLTVPNSPVIAPNTVAIANISRQTRLLLASSDGYLYIYNLPGEREQRHTLFIIPSNYANSSIIKTLAIAVMVTVGLTALTLICLGPNSKAATL